MPGRWTAATAERWTRQQALVLGALATAGWIWFGFSLRRAGQEGLSGVTVDLAFSASLAVTTTIFSAALTAVSCLASLAGSLTETLEEA